MVGLVFGLVGTIINVGRCVRGLYNHPSMKSRRSLVALVPLSKWGIVTWIGG